jgi:hypothetical protein
VASLLDPARTLAWRPGDPRAPAALTDMFPRDEFFVNNGIDEAWEPERPPAARRGAAAAAAGRPHSDPQAGP